MGEPAIDDRSFIGGAPLAVSVRSSFGLPAFVAAVVAFVTFAVTLRGTFIYDDFIVASDDERLHDVRLWFDYLESAYIPWAVDNLYRPLTSLSFAIEWRLHGERLWAFHLVNVLAHAAASAAVAVFAGRLLGRRVAWTAGLLFAVHPVHVEAVAGLVGRAESFCAAGMFTGLALCLGPLLNRRRNAAILGCFAFAVLSKEQGILFPPLAVLLLLIRGRTHPPAATRSERTSRIWLAALLIGAMAGYLIFRQYLLPFGWNRHRMDWLVNPLIRATGSDRWMMPLVLAGRYFGLLIAPIHLSIDYSGLAIGPRVRYAEPYFYLGILAAVTWMGCLVTAVIKRNRPICFCLLAFALTYGMIGNFPVLIGTIFADRLMYIPSAFFIIVVSAAIARLPERAGVAVVALLVALGTARSFTYARQWNDRLGLYQQTTRSQPYAAQAYLLLHDEYRRRRDLPAALRAAREFQAHLPELWQADECVGIAAADLGDLSTADAMLEKAMRQTKQGNVSELWMKVAALRRAEEERATTRPSSTEPAGSLNPR